MGLIQSIIESAGIPTISISLLREVTDKVDPPRVLYVDRPLGYPLGEPGNRALQGAIIKEALGLLDDNALPARKNFAHGPDSTIDQGFN